jgi:hypothetical protein
LKARLFFFFFTYDGFRKVGRVLYSNSNIISLPPWPDKQHMMGLAATLKLAIGVRAIAKET